MIYNHNKNIYAMLAYLFFIKIIFLNDKMSGYLLEVTAKACKKPCQINPKLQFYIIYTFYVK